MDQIIHPAILYTGLVLGAIGVQLAMPRRRVNYGVIGGLLAAAGIGALMVGLIVRVVQAEQLPDVWFYAFAFIAVMSAVRVVTHPRPVYSALYFILTILSSSGLYLLAGAEFLAFALVIIYAGAILITYLFVIMLATQAPSENDEGEQSPYDLEAREPFAAVGLGFLLIAVLTGMLGGGVGELAPRNTIEQRESLLAQLPGKVESELNRRGVLRGLELPETAALSADIADGDGYISLTVRDSEAFSASMNSRRVWELFTTDQEAGAAIASGVEVGDTVQVSVPGNLSVTNLDGVGWALIADQPMALEIAGVILLMAMLGAVVLARKQIEIGEDEKSEAVGAAGGAL